MISKQKQIFHKLTHERLEEITKLEKKVNPDDLIYRYEGPTADAKYKEFDNTLDLIDKIREDKIRLADAKNDQIKLKLELSEIKRGKKRNQSKEKKKKNTLCNIEILYKAKNNAIEFYDDYSSMISGARHEATEEKGLKILTSKQMLQRLPIAFAQVKANNNSNILLNEIRKSVYSLYQSQEISKKV